MRFCGLERPILTLEKNSVASWQSRAGRAVQLSDMQRGISRSLPFGLYFTTAVLGAVRFLNGTFVLHASCDFPSAHK